MNRILFVKNLPFKMTGDEMYEIFGRFGAIKQIRQGSSKDTQGTAFVVYEDIYEAKKACEALNGLNVGNRYIVALYFNKSKMDERKTARERKKDIELLKQHYGLNEDAK